MRFEGWYRGHTRCCRILKPPFNKKKDGHLAKFKMQYILDDMTVSERPGTSYGIEIHFLFLSTYLLSLRSRVT